MKRTGEGDMTMIFLKCSLGIRLDGTVVLRLSYELSTLRMQVSFVPA
jgi:hypothetical protein